PDDADQAESGPVQPGKAVFNALGGAVLRWNVFRGAGDALPPRQRMPDPPLPEPVPEAEP
ncbi:MAG: hypothetical protein U1E05_19060, partial [Patescibacteria group bacterium]|nr:hypothetical protein [Patescibacteria group bacterium]